ncbi:helix-turn-helix transcriptional regulator [Niveibacterium sp.]|uniref:helix-turn-helix transcriptional regulator n=1 Tax=Niveibacterium sp. TaxID=2017444 RepID=UPI0035B019BF
MSNHPVVSNPDEITPQYITHAGIEKLIGITVSKQSLWRWETSGYFPRRVLLGANKSVWRLSEVMQWLSDREAERNHRATPANRFSVEG